MKPTIPTIHVMRYMGNKQKLLPHIVSAVERLAHSGSIVVDLMAGTHAVGYALKSQYCIYANDVQQYVVPIGRALLCANGFSVSSETARDDLTSYYEENQKERIVSFFHDSYSDTYLSCQQCVQLDSIRYAIEKYRQSSPSPDRSDIYLTALISAVCHAQSTPGHFAQFLPADHRRVQPLRQICLWSRFLQCLDKMAHQMSPSHPLLLPIEAKERSGERMRHRVFCGTWQELLECKDILDAASEIGLIYVDPPYSQEQYSRFYHFLETIVLFDQPRVQFKARYRDGRFMSNFCYRGRVAAEFDALLKTTATHFGCPVLISYGSKGLLPKERLLALCQKHYSNVSLQEIPYAHSTLGKGTVPDVMELLFACSNR